MNKSEQEEFFGPREKFSLRPMFINALIIFVTLIASLFIWNLFFKNQFKAQADAVIVNAPQNNAASDWKIYASDQFKFSFKYPDDWQLKELKTVVSLQNVTFVRENTNLFRLTVFENLAKLDSQQLNPISLKDYLDKYAAISTPLYKNISSDKIGNAAGFKVTMPKESGGGTAYLAQITNGQIVTFRFFENTVSETEILSIMASVKFSASLAQTKLKTYTFKDLKFEFKYPETWQDIWMSEIIQDTTKGNHGKAYSSLYKTGSTTPIYFESDKFFGFKIYSIDYNGSPFGAVGPRKVDLNWTKEQFVENMKLPFDVLGYKKLGNNGVLVLDYASYECNPIFNANVYIPTSNINYPNLMINFNLGNIAVSQTVKDYLAIQSAAGKDTCNTKKPFQLIADKIVAGTYSTKMETQVKMAQQIADSFKNL